jgi:hypothetical protein
MVAGVALSHGLHANLFRRGIQHEPLDADLTAFETGSNV